MKYDSRLHKRRRRLLHAFGEGVGFSIASLFADGTDGFYFDFSKTDRLFQNATGTPADEAGENIALAFESHAWAGKSLAEIVATQPELSAPFVTGGAGWSVANADSTHIVTFDNGSVRFQSDTTTPILQLARSGLTLTVGNVYEVTVVCSQYVSGSLKTDSFGGNTVIASGVGTVTFRAKATSTTAFFLRNSSNVDVTLSSISIKKLPGNHGTQATTAAQPKWQTSGLARFDGSDDTLLTTLAPAAAFTMMFKGTMTSASKAFMGSYGTVNVDNCYLITGGSGKLAGGLGTLGSSTILGGSDIRGVLGVGALAFGSSVWRLYWNGSEIATGAYVDGPTTTVPLMLGARNQNGTGGIFGDLDLHYALAIKKALPAAEIAAITNLWGTS